MDSAAFVYSLNGTTVLKLLLWKMAYVFRVNDEYVSKSASDKIGKIWDKLIK